MVSEDVAQRVTGYIQHQARKPRDTVIDLVSQSQEKYLSVLARIDETQTAVRPAPDEWSQRDLVRHVIGAQDGVRLLVHHLARGETPPPSERPRGIGMMIEDDSRSFSALLDELRDVNGAMLQTIRDVPDAPNLELKAPHPFFGPLNCMEWAVFQRVHDEDHAQHAEKIIAATQ